MDEDKGDFGMGLDLKDITKDLFYYSGMPNSLLWLAHFFGDTKWLIFTYHRVCRPSYNNEYLGVPSDVFEKHVRFIKDNFKTVSMLDGVKALQKGSSKEIHAAINFDDGYKDNYEHAYPVLRKYKIPATIFLTTDFIGEDRNFWWDDIFKIINNTFSDKLSFDIGSRKFHFRLNGMAQRKEAVRYINYILRDKNAREIKYVVEKIKENLSFKEKRSSNEMLSWEEINEMKQGSVSFGSHTKTHPNLCLLNDDEVLDELIGSKKNIEQKLGVEIDGFAYPFGIFDKRIRSLVKKAGYKYARTCLKGFNNRNSDKFLLHSIVPDSSSIATRISFSLFRRPERVIAEAYK